jgi:undecaprenyl diphosphate synthase
LNLALNYGGQNELLDAVKNVLYDILEKRIDIDSLTPEVFETYLSTADLPELDLMIRTSGEMRISNFLLWQLAYAEFYVTPVLWPDFRKPHFYQAILDYQRRERRFGNIG